MNYVLPSGVHVSYEYISIPDYVDVSPEMRVTIKDGLGRIVSAELPIKSFGSTNYVPWLTPDKSGPFILEVSLQNIVLYTTSLYVLNESEARHTPGSQTIPTPIPPVFFTGASLFPDSINVSLRTSFGLPYDPHSITYQFILQNGNKATPPLTPAKETIGKYYVAGNLNLPEGSNSIQWVWQADENSPLVSAIRSVTVINYNKYSTSPGVNAGNVVYVCCTCSPCQCMSDC